MKVKKIIQKYNTPHKVLFVNFSKWTFTVCMVAAAILVLAIVQIAKLFS